MIRTRFAPSPTGALHIGSLRTALFNWLFARRHQGEFLLRIEDTDYERSSREHTQKIFETLQWMDLSIDQPPVFQSQRKQRHQEVAYSLLAQGKAYRCYSTLEELEAIKAEARLNNRTAPHPRKWREADPSLAPDLPYVVRLKVPLEGQTKILDRVQGEVVVKHEQLDDMVLLRSDGSPTYMLAVVVDDHDMNITHVIRGDDHLSNTFRQIQIYHGMGWQVPEYAHIPLIHGPDGAKLSKRHGATAAQDFKAMGILPEALENCLLRLGWSHGDDEMITRSESIAWFDLDHVGKSPGRFDRAKLLNWNHHYLQKKSFQEALDLLSFQDCDFGSEEEKSKTLEALKLLMPELQKRSKTLVELKDSVTPYLKDQWALESSQKISLKDSLGEPERNLLAEWRRQAENYLDWSQEPLESGTREFVKKHNVTLGALAKALRKVLVGRPVSPGIFLMLEALGKAKSLGRIDYALELC